VSGIRLVIAQCRTDATKIRKDGTPGQKRIEYTDPHDLGDPIKWLWRFVDGATTAGELYGRALVVICAEQYASRLVVPQSQGTPTTPWASHKDHAAKALHKLAAPHLPASLTQLRRAVERAHRDTATAVARTSVHEEDSAALTADDQGDATSDVSREPRAEATTATDDTADAPAEEQ